MARSSPASQSKQVAFELRPGMHTTVGRSGAWKPQRWTRSVPDVTRMSRCRANGLLSAPAIVTLADHDGLAGEGRDLLGEPIGLFDHQRVAAVLQVHRLGSRDVLTEVIDPARVAHLVVPAMKQQRGNIDVREVAAEVFFEQ